MATCSAITAATQQLVASPNDDGDVTSFCTRNTGSGSAISYPGVMSRYLASLEIAGGELEQPPEQEELQQQQLHTVGARDTTDQQQSPARRQRHRGQRGTSGGKQQTEVLRRRILLKSKYSTDAAAETVGQQAAANAQPQHQLQQQQPESWNQMMNREPMAAAAGGVYAIGGSTSDDDSGCGIEEFTWVPAGLSPVQVHHYMSSIPGYAVPLVGSAGDRNRIRRLLRQLPPHDNEARYCHVTLSEDERRELALFCQRRKREALGRGEVRPLGADENVPDVRCTQCDGPILVGDLVVTAARAGPSCFWHPQCFSCTTCGDLLVDLIYFYSSTTKLLYCGRHHAETLKPRCAACDEIIFSDECTEAEGLRWHMQHFVCAECNISLGGQRYVVRGPNADPDLPDRRSGPPTVYCCDCYERYYADRCETCRQPIRVDEGHMAHAGLHWHATDACFSCNQCHRSLIGCTFIPLGGVVLCAECGNSSIQLNNNLLTDSLTDSCSDYTFSRQAAIKQRLLRPHSPDGSTSSYMASCSQDGTDIITGRHRDVKSAASRLLARAVSRGTASRYLQGDESSDYSDDTPPIFRQKPRRPRRAATVENRRLAKECEPLPNYTQNGDDLPEMGSQVTSEGHYERFLDQRLNCRLNNVLKRGGGGGVVNNRYSLTAVDGYSSDIPGGGKTNVVIMRMSGYSSDSVDPSCHQLQQHRRCSSVEDHKYYDVLELHQELGIVAQPSGVQLNDRNTEPRNHEIMTSSLRQPVVSESVRRYLEAAETWDRRDAASNVGGNGPPRRCSTCSSSSSDSSEFDYYLDRPNDSNSIVSGARMVTSLERRKIEATCTKQCVVS